jgi:hypothetical protein
MTGDNAGRAVKLFANVLKCQGDVPGEVLRPEERLEVAQKLLHQACPLG